MGLLTREMALYQRLATYLDRIHFYTYGDQSTENHILRQMSTRAGEERLRVYGQRWRVSPSAYSLALPVLERGSLERLDVLKTNQVDGSLSAVLAKHVAKKPLVVRCGYLWSEQAGRRPRSEWKPLVASLVEAVAFRAADAVVVSTSRHQQRVISRYGVAPHKVRVIPNFVDTHYFSCPSAGTKIPGRIGFVGRLEPQKNLEALIRAVAALDPPAHLVLFGDGSERSKLEQLAGQLACRVTFAGTVPHQQLPAHLSECQAFVLPSFYEGMPKALIEAMAIGLPIVTTDVPGNAEVVEHSKTALLCGTSADDIRVALRDLLADEGLQNYLGQNAKRVAATSFSIEVTQQLEIAVIEYVCTVP